MLFQSYQKLEQSRPIAILKYPDSEWITINEARLYSTHRTGFVFPNDQIRLELNITNNKPLNIEIQPYFENEIGGKLVDSTETQKIIFGFHRTDSIERYYFAQGEGLNILTVPLKISLSNGTYLTFQNATTAFQVLSQNDKLIIDQNNYIFGSVIASIALVGVLIWQSKLLKRQISHAERTSTIAYEPFISPRSMIVPSVGARLGFSNIGAGSAKDIHIHLSDAQTGTDLVVFDLFAMRPNMEEDRPTNVDTIRNPEILIQGTYQNVIDETKTIYAIYYARTRTTENLDYLFD